MTTPTPEAFSFPHPELTIIDGQPTYTTLRKLQKELYANARAVDSTLGGGAHGHLGVIMPAATYLARATVPYVAPAHPGPQAAHGANATQAQITEANRAYDRSLEVFKLHTKVQSALRQQIIAAVNTLYLQALEDDELGYVCTPAAMLQHLLDTYGDLNATEIEANRALLTATWNPDDPIEDLWLRIREVRAVATRAGEAVNDDTAMRLTLITLENTGVFESALHDWRLKPEADKTYVNFQAHFNTENKERLRKLTAQSAGYHGANVADTPTTPPATPTGTAVTPLAAAAGTPNAPTAPTGAITTNNNVTMYYCWSHGLGMNPRHTSSSCENRREGHQEGATADNMMNGNNTIFAGRPRRVNADA